MKGGSKVLQGVGWCRGGNRYVLGWGIPYVENEKLSIVVSFLNWALPKIQIRICWKILIPYSRISRITMSPYSKPDSISCFLGAIVAIFTVFKKYYTDLQHFSTPIFSTKNQLTISKIERCPKTRQKRLTFFYTIWRHVVSAK